MAINSQNSGGSSDGGVAPSANTANTSLARDLAGEQKIAKQEETTKPTLLDMVKSKLSGLFLSDEQRKNVEVAASSAVIGSSSAAVADAVNTAVEKNVQAVTGVKPEVLALAAQAGFRENILAYSSVDGMAHHGLNAGQQQQGLSIA